MGKFKDLTGQKFGRLTVLSRGENKGINTMWNCICDCGNIKEFYRSGLMCGGSQSCGCLLVDRLFEKGVVKKLDETRQKHLNVDSGTLVHSLYRKTRRDSQTGVKGVSYEKNTNKYRARITFKGKIIELGRHVKLEDAVEARKEAEEKYFQPVIEKAKVQGVIP